LLFIYVFEMRILSRPFDKVHKYRGKFSVKNFHFTSSKMLKQSRFFLWSIIDVNLVGLHQSVASYERHFAMEHWINYIMLGNMVEDFACAKVTKINISQC